jgi:mono/diheme cytochrome c family protein
MSRWRWSGAALCACCAIAASGAIAATEDGGSRYPDGAAGFQANCAVCHGRDGAGQPSLAPPLTSYPARYIAAPEGRRQLAMTVLYGMFGDVVVEQKHYNFKMPDFARLGDDVLAAVLNFVVFDLAHASQDSTPLSAAEIAAARSQPAGADVVRQHRAALLAALGMAN